MQFNNVLSEPRLFSGPNMAGNGDQPKRGQRSITTTIKRFHKQVSLNIFVGHKITRPQ